MFSPLPSSCIHLKCDPASPSEVCFVFLIFSYYESSTSAICQHDLDSQEFHFQINNIWSSDLCANRHSSNITITINLYILLYNNKSYPVYYWFFSYLECGVRMRARTLQYVCEYLLDFTEPWSITAGTEYKSWTERKHQWLTKSIKSL